jgi:hypothetical protein
VIGSATPRMSETIRGPLQIGERKAVVLAKHAGYRPGAGELACKPDSVPRYQETRRRPSIWTHRHRVPRAAYPQARASSPRAPARPHRGAVFLALLRVGFAEPSRSPGMLVRSYRTVSPLLPRKVAVCFLWHFPASHLGLPLAITLLCEVRTFLDQH